MLSRFDRVVNYALILICVHMGHVFVSDLCLSGSVFSDLLIPYGLLYGPAYYFGFVSDKPPFYRKEWKHFLPFVLFILIYFFLLLPACDSSYCRNRYGVAMYFTISFSFLLYGGMAIFFNGRIPYREGGTKIMISGVLGMLLFMMGLVLLSYLINLVESKKEIGLENQGKRGVLLFSGIMGAVSILFFYRIRGVKVLNRWLLFPKDGKPGAIRKRERKDDRQEGPYAKSLVAESLLEHYELQIRELVERNRAFLDEELSLEKLENKLRIPRHHLSQVFSVRIGKSFARYIGELRLNHATKLMHEKPDLSIADIASQSGFASRVSFNRQFKQEFGCTPSEYRNS